MPTAIVFANYIIAKRKGPPMLAMLRYLCLFAAFSLTAWQPASAQDRIAGTISFDGRSVPLTHVHVRQTQPSPTGDGVPQTIVLITDRAAPPQIAASKQAYYTAARAGEITGLLLIFSQPEAKPRLTVFAPGGRLVDTSVPDIFERVTLLELQRDAGSVTGRLTTAEPLEFDYTDPVAAGPDTLVIDVTFAAAVAPVVGPDEVLTGASARQSEAALAAQAFVRMVKQGKASEVLAATAARHPLRAALASGAGEDVLADMGRWLPDADSFLAGVDRVTRYGNLAAVTSKDPEGSSTVWLERGESAWMVADAPIADD